MAEFIIVPLLFGLAMLLLSLGKIFDNEKELHSCKGGSEADSACGSCISDEFKTYKDKTDPGFENVAKLGNPNRNRRFIDKIDFKPERFN